MAFRPSHLRSVKPLFRTEPCVFCQSRQFSRSTLRHASRRPSKVFNGLQSPLNIYIFSRFYATASRSPPEQRRDVDKRARLGYFRMISGEKIIPMNAPTADNIIADFLAAKDKVDPATNAKSLASKYKLKHLEFVTALAIATFKIPDISDPKQRLPPSQHKTISGLMLKACALAKEPVAILHILSAVLVSTDGSIAEANEIARLFTQADISTFRKILEELASEGNTEAMTLQGQFLEKSGKRKEARALYEKAVEKCNPIFDPTGKMPFALPLVQPWNALANLLQNDKDPEARAKVKAALEKGALKGDDPLAYYQLATSEDSMNTNWLKYMSKAAASGHLEAMYSLGNFYMDINSNSSSISDDSKIAKALNWVTTWKPGSPAVHAREWFEVAALMGHKPSMLELAELYEVEGNEKKSREYLQKITESAPKGKPELWPQLVDQARKRLAGIEKPSPKLV